MAMYFLTELFARLSRRDARVLKDSDLAGLVGMRQTLSEELLEWQNAEYERNPYKTENLKINSEDKKPHRSKSESIIEDMLKKRGIPYRYECVCKLPSGKLYPDFTIRHPVTGEIYLWEHLGMMDDTAYAANAVRKLCEYDAGGYKLMVNLIVTGETLEDQFDFRKAALIIDYFFM